RYRGRLEPDAHGAGGGTSGPRLANPGGPRSHPADLAGGPAGRPDPPPGAVPDLLARRRRAWAEPERHAEMDRAGPDLHPNGGPGSWRAAPWGVGRRRRPRC